MSKDICRTVDLVARRVLPISGSAFRGFGIRLEFAHFMRELDRFNLFGQHTSIYQQQGAT
jgi:hypothetical protein